MLSFTLLLVTLWTCAGSSDETVPLAKAVFSVPVIAALLTCLQCIFLLLKGSTNILEISVGKKESSLFKVDVLKKIQGLVP
jgi:hypothetical protein